jgi:hypothetical protein
MSDIGKSGNAVTLPSTGYFLKLLFMFISCIIMNIFMFNCCLNINTCTWIVSLTAILKCLFNYGIKIYQNIAIHLTLSASSATRWLASWQPGQYMAVGGGGGCLCSLAHFRSTGPQAAWPSESASWPPIVLVIVTSTICGI